ncbi:putative angiotensin-converting enzyme isoform X3, partial [Apostichopus japonicus]
MMAYLLTVLLLPLVAIFSHCWKQWQRNGGNHVLGVSDYNEQAQIIYPQTTEVSWTYNTDITQEHEEAMIAASLESAAFAKGFQVEAKKFNRTGFSEDTNRQLEKLLYIGDAAIEDDNLFEELSTLLAKMETRYSSGQVCLTADDCYELEPGLTRIMATSRNYDELYWAWDEWRDAVGALPRGLRSYVELKNIGAAANDQPDCGAYWRSWYETPDLRQQVETLYNQLQPLYQNLHAYVRRKLYDLYGSDYINLEGPIPAHLLGNMWAQSWSGLLDLVEPFPGKPSVDITPNLVSK